MGEIRKRKLKADAKTTYLKSEECLILTRRGHSIAEAAEELRLDVRTVENYLRLREFDRLHPEVFRAWSSGHPRAAVRFLLELVTLPHPAQLARWEERLAKDEA